MLNCKKFEPKKTIRDCEGNFKFIYSDFDNYPEGVSLNDVPLEQIPQVLWIDSEGIAKGGSGKIKKAQLTCATFRAITLSAYELTNKNVNFELFCFQLYEIMKIEMHRKIEDNLQKLNDFLIDGD